MGGYKRFFRLGIGRSQDLRRELEQEIETHVALRTDDLVARGLSPDAAREEALRRFGDLKSARRELYASARRREGRLKLRVLADDVRRDLRLSFRQARRAAGFSAVAVAIYAVAIGLTTSMFTVVDHVLLRPLPFPEPDRLVALGSVTEGGQAFYLVSMANWVDWHTRNTTLGASAVYQSDRLTVGTGDEVLRAEVTTVAGGFFEAIRPQMDAGRPFSEQEAEQEAPVVVLSYAFADRIFGNASPLGALLSVDGKERTVIGVAALGGQFPDGAELWIPERARPGSGGMRNNINWRSVARMRDGTDATVVETELSTIAHNIRQADPEAIYSYGVSVQPLRVAVAGDAAEYLSLLMAAVLFVLLVACANLAGLSLARGKGRAGEVGVRLALGAGRSRLTRQLLTEHLVLAFVGGALGLVLAWLAGGVAMEQIRATLPRATEIRLDYRIAAACFLATLVAGLLAGIVPALRASSHVNLSGLVGGRGGIVGGRGLPGATLVATEIALALTLLIGGGLLVRSFRAVIDRDLGFQSEDVMTLRVALVGEDYQSPERTTSYWTDLLAGVSQMPGVEAAAAGNWIPTGGGGRSFIELPDNPNPTFGAGYRVVSDDYFDALRIPLLVGRTFDSTDELGTERVTLVNQTLANRVWPGENPIGRRIRPYSMEGWMYDGSPPWLTVIGVVGDVRHDGFEADPDTELFVLYRQVPGWTDAMTAVVRTAPGTPSGLVSSIGDRIRALDPGLAIEISSLDDRVRGLLDQRRQILAILSSFAVAALLLAALGIYGIVSFAAAQRTREMAIRAALGAQRSGVLRLMLASATRIVLAGTLAGLVASYWLTNLMESLVVDVTTTDPVTYLSSAALLVAVGILAALIPSVRAARLDPTRALHSN